MYKSKEVGFLGGAGGDNKKSKLQSFIIMNLEHFKYTRMCVCVCVQRA
jgi:hypothetical protein